MLSSAIDGNVDIIDRSKQLTRTHQNNQAHAVDKLLLSLVQKSKHKVTNRESRTVIADLFDINKLQAMRQIFVDKNVSERHNDDCCITADDFKQILSSFVSHREVEMIYGMIDVSDTHKIYWQSFVNYLIAIESSNRHAEGNYTSQFQPREHQQRGPSTHKDLITQICYSSRSPECIITGGRDGQVILWNPTTLKPISSVRHKDKNTVFLQEMNVVASKEQRAVLARSKNDQSTGKKSPMITCLDNMALSDHICVGSVDGAMTIYDKRHMEVTGRYTSMKDVPTALTVCYPKQLITSHGKEASSPGAHGLEQQSTSKILNQASTLSNGSMATKANEIEEEEKVVLIPTIIVGDSRGHLHILSLDIDFRSSVEHAQKLKNEKYFKQAVHGVKKFQIGDSNISALRYLDDMSVLCIAMYNGDIQMFDYYKHTIRATFTGHKNGIVVDLHWSFFGKYICSVGDRKVLIWDAFNAEVMNSLEGLTAPAVAVCIADTEKKLFVGAVDKTVRIWQSITFELLQVVVDTTHQSPENIMSSFLFVQSPARLYTAGNLLSMWAFVRQRAGNEVKVSPLFDDICSVLYNRTFKTVICVSKAGNVAIYNIEDGSDSNRFIIPNNTPPSLADEGVISPDRTINSTSQRNDAAMGDTLRNTQISTKQQKEQHYHHLPTASNFITMACLDAVDKRLVIYTHVGIVQFWNFTTGTLLFEVNPQVPTSMAHLAGVGNKPSTAPRTPGIHSNLHHDAYRVTTIDHCITTADGEEKRLLTLGSNCGFFSCLLETAGYIDDEPSFSLLKNEDRLDLDPQQKKIKNDIHTNADADDALSVRSNQSIPMKPQVALLCCLYMSESNMAVTYSDGSVSYWDLERGQLEYEFDTSNAGIILGCIQRSNHRGVKIHRRLIGRRKKKDDKNNNENSNYNNDDADDDNDDNNNSDSDDDENSKPKKEEDEAEKDLKDIHSISGVVNRLSNLGILKQMAEESKIAQEEERKRKEAELKEKEIHDAQERRRRLFIEKQEKERAERLKMQEKHKPTKPSLFLQIKPSFRPRLNRNKLLLPPPPPLVDDASGGDGDEEDSLDGRNKYNNDTFDADVNAMSTNRARRVRMLTTAESSINRISNLGDDSNRRHKEAGDSGSAVTKSIDPTPPLNETPAVVPSKVDESIGRGRSVLLADESIVSLKFHNRLLTDNGFAVKPVSDGQSVLKALHETKYDVLIVDIFMPVISYGAKVSVIEVITKKMQFPIPIIVTTTAENPPGMEKHSNGLLGVKAYLKKPSDDVIVIQCLTAVLREVDLEKTTVVTSVVFFHSSHVLVGVSSDKMIKFWDVSTGKVLCSCKSDEALAPTSEINNDAAIVVPSLQTLKVAKNEETLVGAYDNGVIRVWEVVHSSIDTLRASLYSKITADGDGDLVDAVLSEAMRNRYVNVAASTGGLAVSPLSLISEWRAHDALIISLSYISLAEFDNHHPLKHEDPSAFEKDEFILSAGMDQAVYLWNTKGKLIGIFGTDDWNVDAFRSYRENEITFRDKMRQPILQQPNPPESVKDTIEATYVPKRSVAEQEYWRKYRDEVRGVGSRALNRHTSNLQHKHDMSSLREQNREYRNIQKEHRIEFDKIDAMEKEFNANVLSYEIKTGQKGHLQSKHGEMHNAAQHKLGVTGFVTQFEGKLKARAHSHMHLEHGDWRHNTAAEVTSFFSKKKSS